MRPNLNHCEICDLRFKSVLTKSKWERHVNTAKHQQNINRMHASAFDEEFKRLSKIEPSSFDKQARKLKTEFERLAAIDPEEVRIKGKGIKPDRKINKAIKYRKADNKTFGSFTLQERVTNYAKFNTQKYTYSYVSHKHEDDDVVELVQRIIETHKKNFESKIFIIQVESTLEDGTAFGKTFSFHGKDGLPDLEARLGKIAEYKTVEIPNLKVTIHVTDDIQGGKGRRILNIVDDISKKQCVNTI